MAALSEADMMKILGDNYRAVQDADEAARGVQVEERLVRQAIGTLEDSKFPACVTIFVGAALIIAGYFTAAGKEFWIQAGIGLVILLAGIGGLIYVRGKLETLKKKADELHKETAALAAGLKK